MVLVKRYLILIDFCNNTRFFTTRLEYVNVQVEVIQSVITSLENTTRQLKRVFVQLADTQKKKVE